jgi:hypothetical protein
MMQPDEEVGDLGNRIAAAWSGRHDGLLDHAGDRFGRTGQ